MYMPFVAQNSLLINSLLYPMCFTDNLKKKFTYIYIYICIANTSKCIKELTLNCTFIKISVSRQVFSCYGQNHIMSYKTTRDICSKCSMYRKYSNTLVSNCLHRLLIVWTIHLFSKIGPFETNQEISEHKLMP